MASLVRTAALSSAASVSRGLSTDTPRSIRRQATSHASVRRTFHVSVSAADGSAASGVAQADSKSAVAAAVVASSAPVLGSVMTDATVPEGHQGLHGFLYGEQGADVHDAPVRAYEVREGEDDGSLLVPLPQYVAPRDAMKLAGIYAVFDAHGGLQYVGLSRNVVLALKSHLSFVGEERAASVRVRVYSDIAMVTRSRLDDERLQWMGELTGDANLLPPGNSTDVSDWEGPSGPGTAAMSAAELAGYEEKKLKLRKAMGENLHDEVEDETEDARERRMNLLRAVEGDDWSSVIDKQTASTVGRGGRRTGAADEATKKESAAAEAEAEAEAEAPGIVSPFARMPGGAAAAAAASVSEAEMTVAAVDAALDVVRPYLIADGGNVEVVRVVEGVVAVRLQGACGTCPSSTSTMKMGIEAELQRQFPTQLKEVQQVDVIDTSVTVAAVDAHLDILRPAINNFGGKVQVQSVDEGESVCVVAYEGPPTVAMGIQAAIKDKFPTIKTVNVVAFA